MRRRRSPAVVVAQLGVQSARRPRGARGGRSASGPGRPGASRSRSAGRLPPARRGALRRSRPPCPAGSRRWPSPRRASTTPCPGRPTCRTRSTPRAGTGARGRGPARTRCPRSPPRRDGPGGRPAGAGCEGLALKPSHARRLARARQLEEPVLATCGCRGHGRWSMTRLDRLGQSGDRTVRPIPHARRKTCSDHFRWAGYRVVEAGEPIGERTSLDPDRRIVGRGRLRPDRGGDAAAAIIRAAADDGAWASDP